VERCISLRITLYKLKTRPFISCFLAICFLRFDSNRSAHGIGAGGACRLLTGCLRTGRATARHVIPAADRIIFGTIRDHEITHVEFLAGALGASARPKPTFDFTAGNGSGNGPYADVFTNYETFKAVAQAFEDTGVRAYKGQAPALRPYKDMLTAALTIHSVEARHASQVRRLRGNFADTEPFHQGWINLNNTDVPGAAATYAGEQNTIHAGINAAAVSDVALDEVTEAFDEPLSMGQVLAIVNPFIV
jgi:hypothetical protein